MSVDVKTGAGSGSPIGPESYAATPEEMDAMEASVVGILRNSLSQDYEGVAALIVESEDPLANFGRTSEPIAFLRERGEEYDFYKGMRPYEEKSSFLYTVDLAQGRIAHIKRLVFPNDPSERQITGLTGIDVIDDRVSSTDPDEHVGLEDIMRFFKMSEDDLQRSFCVSTNVTTSRVEAEANTPPHIFLSYKATFLLFKAKNYDRIFAYLNVAAAHSLGGLGLESQLLQDKEFHLPIPQDDGSVAYDNDYVAVCLPR